MDISSDTVTYNATHGPLSTFQLNTARNQSFVPSILESNLPNQYCNLCNQYFSRSFLLRRHVEEVHRPGSDYICQICGRSFGNARHFRNHRAIHGRLGQTQDQPEPVTSTILPALSRVNLTPETSYLRDSRFIRLSKKFNNEYNWAFKDQPCVKCGMLLFLRQVKWLPYCATMTYPLQLYLGLAVPVTTIKKNLVVPCCSICFSKPKPWPLWAARPWPDILISLPARSQLYLSPLTFQTNLGRTTGARQYLNPWSTYRTVTGGMKITKNPAALQLYSGLLGGFLESSTRDNDSGHDLPTLEACRDWLLQNNPVYQRYCPSIQTVQSSSLGGDTLPRWETSDMEEMRPLWRPDIVMHPYSYPRRTHDEDYRSSHLLQAHFKEDVGHWTGKDDSLNELLLFPCLYPYGVGQWSPRRRALGNTRTRNTLRSENLGTDCTTLGKDVKAKLCFVLSYYRDNHYWAPWMYMRVEEHRIFQNAQRLTKAHQQRSQSGRLTRCDWIQQSRYGDGELLNETITHTIPTGIRTGEAYYNDAESKIRCMFQTYGDPHLFITLTFSERWPEYAEIISRQGNRDTIPSNRPWDAVVYYYERFRHILEFFLKSPRVTGFGGILHHVIRHEFQLRGAIHSHCLFWVRDSIPKMIEQGLIRADLPDAETEPLLRAAVLNHQTHTCSVSLCRKHSDATDATCKKGFPAPLSSTTHQEPGNKRYTYKRQSDADRNVVPYMARLLLLWGAHCNVQYCTRGGLASYVSKYVTKSEPKGLYHATPHGKKNPYREHVLARRLGSMEVMVLNLSYPVFEMSTATVYLPTSLPTDRTAAVKPYNMITARFEHQEEDLELDEDELFFYDKLEHYFGRPIHNEVESLNYFEYYCRYECRYRSADSKNVIGRDRYGYTVYRRREPRLHQVTTRRIEDGEVFWYQRLLGQHHWRSEEEILGGYDTYREHFCAQWPTEYAQLQFDIQSSESRTLMELSNSFATGIAQIVADLSQIDATTVTEQLTNIRVIKPIPTMLHYAFNLQGDQYEAFNVLTHFLNQRNRTQGFSFFVTGGAGSGKTHLLHALSHWCENRRYPYLKMAPTGIAACNIDGRTIHSALHISIGNSFGQSKTNILRTEESRKSFQQYRLLIIDEVSMVSSNLLTFISSIFAQVHGESHLYTPFGGVNVVCFGDLLQLPPVSGLPVYYSPVWQHFTPLILRGSFRQQEDPEFLDTLNHIRQGNISSHVKARFTDKYCGSFSDLTQAHLSNSLTLQTTALVSLRTDAATINRLILRQLPNNMTIVHKAIDREGMRVLSSEYNSEHLFKRNTNLPESLTCLIGARVMFLNNIFISKDISNGSCGVVIGFDADENPRVAFPVKEGIELLTVYPITSHFQINGISYSRTQYPLQNAFALTVHKTQGLTLQGIAIRLDQSMFAYGHAYTALSRAKRWSDVILLALDWNSVKADPGAVTEYARLDGLAKAFRDREALLRERVSRSQLE